MKWGDLRPGDSFLCRDAVGIYNPTDWIGRVYTVLTVNQNRYPLGERDGVEVEITVLGPGGVLPKPWAGMREEEYYEDELISRRG